MRKSQTFSCSVRHINRENGAAVVTFIAEFRALKRARVDALLARASAGTLGDDAFLEEALAGWSGLSGGVNAEFVYDAANLAALCERYPGLAGSIVAAYAQAEAGRTGVQTSGSP